jgi:hypothetical protein
LQQKTHFGGQKLINLIPTSCPYCGENIDLFVEPMMETQDYIEDCQVCCRPISISVETDENGSINLVVRHENE